MKCRRRFISASGVRLMSKKEKSPEKKKNRKKKVLRVLGCILAFILVFAIVTTCVSLVGIKSNTNKAKLFPAVGCDLSFENAGNGVWNIRSDKELKVLQLTDVHIGAGWLSIRKDSMALNAVAAMISAEKPDLVIVTGDIAYPVPFQAGTFNNKTSAKMFATLMEQLGVYWTFAFGNHDTEAYSYFSRSQIADFYSSGDFPHCIFQPGPDDVDGYCNQIFNIINSDGIITRALITLDSHSYVDGDYFGIRWFYDNMHENQVQWYKNSVQALAQHNAEVCKASPELAAKYTELCKVVPSSLFFHIPLTEYKDAWNEYVENGYKDTENVKFNYGAAGEKGKVVYCGIHDDNLFETILELGSTDTVFCGHDHLNNFSVNYKGVDLTYGYSVDYLAYIGIYKLGSQRGCTVINIAPDGAISHEQQNYYQDKYISHYEKEPVEMQVLGAAE